MATMNPAEESDKNQSDSPLHVDPHVDPPLPALFAWRYVEDRDAELERFLAANYSTPSTFMVEGAAVRLQFHFTKELLRFMHAGQPGWSRLLLTANGEWLGHLSGTELFVRNGMKNTEDTESAKSASVEPEPTYMISLMAVPERRRRRRGGGRLIRHLFARARAAGVRHLAYAFTVPPESDKPHALECTEPNRPDEVGWTVACGRAEAVFQVPLYHVALGDRLMRFGIGRAVEPRRIEHARPLTAVDLDSVRERLCARDMGGSALATHWDTPRAERFLRRLLSDEARAAGVRAVVFEKTTEGKTLGALAVIYPGPSDIYCGAANPTNVEIFAGDQMRAAYLYHLEPLCAPQDFDAETRRALARDLLRVAARAGFDAFFLPAQGLLTNSDSSDSSVIEKLDCEFDPRRTCDQRYYWTRIGAPEPTPADAQRSPADLFVYTL